MEIISIVLGHGDGVISLRFFTDSPSAAPAPVTNRLGNAEWGQFIEGQVIADGLAEELNTAAEDAAAGQGDPDIEKSSVAVGHWNASARSAHSSVSLTAVDALPADVDVPITIYATTHLALDPLLDRIELTTHISWAAHDIITEVSSGAIEVVEDKVSEGILDKLKPRPGQQEIQRGDRFVVYRSYRPFMEPVTNLFSATVDSHILDDTGVGATGPANVYPPPVAHFTLEDQHWESGVNCQARRWQTSFEPPKVHIFGVDRFHGLRILSSPTADPPGFWNPQVSWSGFGPGNQIAHITFETPPFPPGDDGQGRVGKTSSGFIMTNLGIRWVDLGTVPARPAEPANRLGIQAYVYNRCLQLTDRWGMGVLNLDWLVDPPDLDLGMPPLREWTIVGSQILEASEIELVATGPAGERTLAAVPVERNTIFAQVVTDADETLQVRSNAALAPTPPQIFQRWIIPWASTPVGADARELAMDDGDVLVLEDQDVMRLVLQGHRGLARTSPERSGADRHRFARLFRGRREGARSLIPRTAARGRAVAVLHRGEAVLGFAGPALRASEGLVRTETTSAQTRSEALETT